MKIYDMIEGKWLKTEKKEKEGEKKDKRKELEIVPRLVAHGEEKVLDKRFDF